MSDDRSTASPPLLQLQGIEKIFPAEPQPVRANDGIDLCVRAGEIHAVLGENGAGKSTLMKIIFGLLRPDAGSMRWQGQPVQLASPQAARALGIGMVFQHFSLFDSLSVLENMRAASKRAHQVHAQRAGASKLVYVRSCHVPVSNLCFHITTFSTWKNVFCYLNNLFVVLVCALEHQTQICCQKNYPQTEFCLKLC
jgi:ABC-type sugar transport system ATPase subunit